MLARVNDAEAEALLTAARTAPRPTGGASRVAVNAVTAPATLALMAASVDHALDDMRRWATQLRRRSVTATHHFLAAFPPTVLSASRPFDAMRAHCAPLHRAAFVLGIALPRSNRTPIRRPAMGRPWTPDSRQGLWWLARALCGHIASPRLDVGRDGDDLAAAGAMAAHLVRAAAQRGRAAAWLTAPLIAAEALEHALALPPTLQLVGLVAVEAPGAPTPVGPARLDLVGPPPPPLLLQAELGAGWRIDEIAAASALHAHIPHEMRRTLERAQRVVAIGFDISTAQQLEEGLRRGWTDPWATVDMVRRLFGRAPDDDPAAPARGRGAAARRRPGLGWFVHQLRRLRMVGERLSPAPVDTWQHFARCRPDVQGAGAGVHAVFEAAQRARLAATWLGNAPSALAAASANLSLPPPWRVGALVALTDQAPPT